MENSRRFSGRMMVAGLACFLLMLIMFLGRNSDRAGKGHRLDRPRKSHRRCGGGAVQIGLWTRRYAPHDPAYEEAVERFVTLASTLQAELRDTIARHDPAYPNAERALRNVERWIGAAKTGSLPPGARSGLGIEKSGLEFALPTRPCVC